MGWDVGFVVSFRGIDSSAHYSFWSSEKIANVNKTKFHGKKTKTLLVLIVHEEQELFKIVTTINDYALISVVIESYFINTITLCTNLFENYEYR